MVPHLVPDVQWLQQRAPLQSAGAGRATRAMDVAWPTADNGMRLPLLILLTVWPLGVDCKLSICTNGWVRHQAPVDGHDHKKSAR